MLLFIFRMRALHSMIDSLSKAVFLDALNSLHPGSQACVNGAINPGKCSRLMKRVPFREQTDSSLSSNCTLWLLHHNLKLVGQSHLWLGTYPTADTWIEYQIQWTLASYNLEKTVPITTFQHNFLGMCKIFSWSDLYDKNINILSSYLHFDKKNVIKMGVRG